MASGGAVAETLDDEVRSCVKNCNALVGSVTSLKKRGHFQSAGVADIYQAISVMRQDGFEVSHLCEALNVHRNGYYQWMSSTENIYQQQDSKLTPIVQDIFFEHRRRYGARRIAIEIQSPGESCSRAKVRKIMEQNGLTAIQPKSFKPRTTESRHKLSYSPNLLLE